MDIIEVGFGLTKNLGNYESLRIDLKAVVNDGESATDVLDALRTKVAQEADFDDTYKDLVLKVSQKERELYSLVNRIVSYNSQIRDCESQLTLVKDNCSKLLELVGSEALSPLMTFFRGLNFHPDGELEDDDEDDDDGEDGDDGDDGSIGDDGDDGSIGDDGDDGSIGDDGERLSQYF